MRTAPFHLSLLAIVLMSGSAFADDASHTADVLGRLHRSNLAEIELAKLALQRGSAPEIKGFGRALVKDHTSVEKKVIALAKAQKIELSSAVPPTDASRLPEGTGFDAAFARMMLDDHTKAVAEAQAARAATKDDNLRRLLDEILPVLQKHKESAQRLVDEAIKT